MKKVSLIVAIVITFAGLTACGCQSDSYNSTSNVVNENTRQAISAAESTEASKNLKYTRLVKRLLKSTETVDFLYGIAVLSEMLYDGGHTYLKNPIIDNIDAAAVEKFDEVGENENDPRTILIPRYSLNIMGMVRLKPQTLNMMTPEYMFFQVLKRIPLRILGRHLIWPKNMV